MKPTCIVTTRLDPLRQQIPRFLYTANTHPSMLNLGYDFSTIPLQTTTSATNNIPLSGSSSVHRSWKHYNLTSIPCYIQGYISLQCSGTLL